MKKRLFSILIVLAFVLADLHTVFAAAEPVAARSEEAPADAIIPDNAAETAETVPDGSSA